MAERRIKTIVFDWNGTLLNDTPSVLQTVNIILAKAARPPIDMKTFSDGHNWPLNVEDDWPAKAFYRDIGLTDAELDVLADIERDLFHDTYETLAENAPLHAGTVEILKAFSADGVQSLILSNHLIEEIRKGLERFSIGQYFAEVLAYVDRETQFKDMTKGERLRRYMADKKLKPENTLIIGDTGEEIQIARELGLVSVAITGGVMTGERLRAAKPDHLIHSLHELLPIIQKREAA